jgi:hypothetical protein
MTFIVNMFFEKRGAAMGLSRASSSGQHPRLDVQQL